MRIVLAADDVNLRSQIRQLVLNFGHECSGEDAVSLDRLTFRVTQSPPQVVLVVLGHPPDAGLKVLSELDERSDYPLLAVGPPNDSQLFMQTMRSGAREYLDQTKLRDEFAMALKKIARELPAHGTPVGKAIAVTAANAGHGVTTVATNLAFTLAEIYPKKVGLAELGNGVPELALALDLEPRNPVDQLLDDWERMDPGMIARACVDHAAGVQVLAYAPQTLVAGSFDTQAICQTILLLRTIYDVSVIDMGHSATPAALEAMKVADAVVVVSRGDVPALRLCRVYLRHLKDHGIAEEKIWRVANRFGQRRQIGWRQMEEAVGKSFHAWIPDDSASINAAINLGVPVIEKFRRSKFIQRFRNLAKNLNGKP